MHGSRDVWGNLVLAELCVSLRLSDLSNWDFVDWFSAVNVVYGTPLDIVLLTITSISCVDTTQCQVSFHCKNEVALAKSCKNFPESSLG